MEEDSYDVMDRLVDHVNFEQKISSKDDICKTHNLFYQNRALTNDKREIAMS